MSIDWISFGLGLAIGVVVTVIPYVVYRARQNVVRQQREIFDENRRHIDDRVRQMDDALERVRELVSDFEKAREYKLGELGKELGQLTNTTQQFTNLLSNNQTRGQWGERMADDIIRAVGFAEGVNYLKQATLIGHGKQSRPDFTFLLPNGSKVHMDVKFSLNNYQQYLAAQADSDKEKHRSAFLKDVRGSIDSVCGRDYINDDTLNFVIVFIPVEHIYQFIHEVDPAMIDYAFAKNVVVCSPVTLYTVLMIIRQATKNYRLEQSAKQVLSILTEVKKEWDKYTEKMNAIGDALKKAQENYESVVGIRKKALDKRFGEIEKLLDVGETIEAESEA